MVEIKTFIESAESFLAFARRNPNVALETMYLVEGMVDGARLMLIQIDISNYERLGDLWDNKWEPEFKKLLK